MVNEDAALLNRRVTHMTPAALFSRRLHRETKNHMANNRQCLCAFSEHFRKFAK
jgi:alkaline phosphatase